MSQKAFLAELILTIETAGIPYMLTGSFASSYHGEPRASNDADIVISPTRDQIESFLESLGPDYYVDPDTARQAFDRRSMFNVIDCRRGWKADLIIRKERPFSSEEFRRRNRGTIAGVKVMVATPEDIILTKLEWTKKGASEIQFRDALGVASVQFSQLDIDYLGKWAKELGVNRLLNAVLEQAEALQRPN